MCPVPISVDVEFGPPQELSQRDARQRLDDSLVVWRLLNGPVRARPARA